MIFPINIVLGLSCGKHENSSVRGVSVSNRSRSGNVALGRQDVPENCFFDRRRQEGGKRLTLCPS
jgi:D-serine dehydratase